MEELAVLGGFANHVSMTQTGLPTTTAGELASMVFAKCCAHARSIGAIVNQSSMFDHHAVMALARMIMEASTMISYLNDPVGADEWELRHTVLRLHDTATRIKLLRGFGSPADDLRAGREELKAKLVSLPLFSALPEQRRDRILTGEEMFTTGMRSVAIKKMGWDEDKFTAVYAYLSAHAHSAPVSFMRMREHQIDYMTPSETQMESLGISMLVAISCLRRVMVRQIDLHPDQFDQYQPDLLAEARTEDAACPLFNRRPASP